MSGNLLHLTDDMDMHVASRIPGRAATGTAGALAVLHGILDARRGDPYFQAPTGRRPLVVASPSGNAWSQLRHGTFLVTAVTKHREGRLLSFTPDLLPSRPSSVRVFGSMEHVELAPHLVAFACAQVACHMRGSVGSAHCLTGHLAQAYLGYNRDAVRRRWAGPLLSSIRDGLRLAFPSATVSEGPCPARFASVRGKLGTVTFGMNDDGMVVGARDAGPGWLATRKHLEWPAELAGAAGPAWKDVLVRLGLELPTPPEDGERGAADEVELGRAWPESWIRLSATHEFGAWLCPPAAGDSPPEP